MDACALLILSLLNFALAACALEGANEGACGIIPLGFYVVFATFYIVLGALSLKDAWSVL